METQNSYTMMKVMLEQSVGRALSVEEADLVQMTIGIILDDDVDQRKQNLHRLLGKPVKNLLYSRMVEACKPFKEYKNTQLDICKGYDALLLLIVKAGGRTLDDRIVYKCLEVVSVNYALEKKDLEKILGVGIDSRTYNDILLAASFLHKEIERCKKKGIPVVRAQQTFRLGMDVEVTAEIIGVGNNTFMVEYKHLAENGTHLKEKVHGKRIRPIPPPTREDYTAGQIVEVRHNFGWLEGELLALRQGSYAVYFEDTNSVRMYEENELRHRQHWEDGSWELVAISHTKGVTSCTMCMKQMNEEASTMCAHFFCKVCIERCPICMKQLREKNKAFTPGLNQIISTCPICWGG